jgi:hypothetical protein
MIRAFLVSAKSFMSDLPALLANYVFNRNGILVIATAVGALLVLYVTLRIVRNSLPAGSRASTLAGRATAYLEKLPMALPLFTPAMGILLLFFYVVFGTGWIVYQLLNLINNDFFEFSLIVLSLTCTAIILTFVIFRKFNLALGAVGAQLSRLDFFLAERVAALGISRSNNVSWLRILAVFLIIDALLGTVPPVVAIALLGFLIVFTIAIHRRWSRTETGWDRLDAESLNPAGENHTAADLSDEALLASILLLLAFPQCLHQMHAWGPILRVPGDVRNYEWYWFAFSEFLKEFPQVGWADVFDWKVPRRIDFLPSEHPTRDPARIVIFLMKASIDFLVLNAIGSILSVRRSILAGRRPTEFGGEGLRRYGEERLTKWTYAKLDAVRARGIEGLGFFTESSRACERCLQILNEDRSRSPSLAAEALQSLRKHNKKVEEFAVRQLLQDPPSLDVLAEAIRSAHAYRLTNVDDSILAALKNSDVDVLRAAINAADALLLRDTRLEARPLLEALLGNERVRDSAIDALGKLGDATSVPPLVKLAEKLDGRDAKERIARTIGKIGDETALQYLGDISIFGVSIPAGKGSPPRREFVSGASEAIRSIKERVSAVPSSAPEKS